jgi:sodium/proline symporter
MSIFKDKRVFGIKRNNSGGLETAGQVCANDIILWVIFMLPINIVVHGAGQCFVAVGLFVGNVFGWIFLAKRMNSYADISKKKIHNAPELFAARYSSQALKNLVSVVWIITLGMILVSVLKVIVSMVAYFMGWSEKVCLIALLGFLLITTIFIDNRLMGIVKTVIFLMMIIACMGIIAMVFYRMDVFDILDNFRLARLAGGTSVYLNILYYDGEPLNLVSAISMLGTGLGCIAMPLMYKGVINIRDVKELDKGRIWAIALEGFAVILTSALALLAVPVLYTESVPANQNSFQLYNQMMKTLIGNMRYGYYIRTGILMIFIIAVVVMLESFMRNVCEHIRGLIKITGVTRDSLKLLIDVLTVVITGLCLYFVAEFAKYDRESMIITSWGLCIAALAAPLIVTLMYRDASAKAMYAGIFVGIISFFIWKFLPIYNGESLQAASGISSDLAGFVCSFFAIALVGRVSKNTDQDELKTFDRMRESQS